MDPNKAIDLLLHGNQLKQTARTGWAQRGVPNPEDVAAHSYGVAYIALMLAFIVDAEFDLSAVLAMAVLHDLPEGQTSDIPAPAWDYLPEGSKPAAERQAMEKIAAGWQFEDALMNWWGDLQEANSAESKLVHDADKLDLFLQAWVYARQTGNSQLAEFWATPPHLHFSECQTIYDELRRRALSPS